MKNIYMKFFLTCTIFICFSCTNNDSTTNKSEIAKTYVLVHGAYHGKWCWENLIPKIEELGHEVIAIDLPGMGSDSTPIHEIKFEDYVDKICSTVNDQGKKVILVGHSIGGISISAATEECSENIESIVYLTATVLKNGESLLNNSVEDPNPSGVAFYKISEDGSYAEVLKEKAQEVFYHDCNDKDIEFAISKLRPQPLKPIIDSINLSDEKFGAVPKYFVECTNDRIFSIELQRVWQKRFPFEKVFTMNTSHSPFLAAPEELARILSKIE